MHSTAKRERLVPLFIVIVTIVAFLPALRNGFVAWDDETNFIHNPSYRGLGVTQLRWMWTTTLMGHYVPLSWMSLGLDYKLWGMNASGYHLTSILIHSANAVLVYLIAREMFRAAGAPRLSDPARQMLAAALAALLFSLHPLRVESVAWATERRDVLSCFFFFASILAYLRFAAGSSNAARWYAAALCLFVASLLSKATSMTLPVVLLLINVYPLRRVDLAFRQARDAWGRVLKELAPFGILAIAAAFLSVVALRPGPQLSIVAKLGVSVYSLGFYVWKTLLPVRLSPLYEMPLVVDPFTPRFIAAYCTVAIICVLAWRFRGRYPAAAIAWIAFVVVTAPMLGIVQNGPQIAADRYTYYSAAALSILGAGALFSAGGESGTGRLIISVGVLCALGAATWTETSVWHDSLSLWNRVLSLDDRSSYAHVGLARLDFDRGDFDGAIEHYRRASELLPTYSEGYNNIGNAMVREGRLDEAIEQYHKALTINSNYPEARNNWGSVLARQGKFADAVTQFRMAIALEPAYAEAHGNLGAALFQVGDYAGAIDEYQRAIAIDSTYADAHINWGNALARLGKPQLAVQQYAAAIRIRPGDANAQRNWGATLAQQGDIEGAISHFRQAVAIDPNNAELQADLDRAVSLQQRAASKRQP